MAGSEGLTRVFAVEVRTVPAAAGARSSRRARKNAPHVGCGEPDRRDAVVTRSDDANHADEVAVHVEHEPFQPGRPVLEVHRPLWSAVAHLKYLHSVVAVVRDVHPSRRVDRDTPGAVELAVAETA